MKALLHFCTEIGPRTVVVEIGDAVTARAVVNAHLALGEMASLVDEVPRLALRDLVTRRKRALAKATKLTVVSASANVTQIHKARG